MHADEIVYVFGAPFAPPEFCPSWTDCKFYIAISNYGVNKASFYSIIFMMALDTITVKHLIFEPNHSLSIAISSLQYTRHSGDMKVFIVVKCI